MSSRVQGEVDDPGIMPWKMRVRVRVAKAWPVASSGLQPASKNEVLLQSTHLLYLTSCAVDRGYPGLPQWLSSKESACNARATADLGLVPGLGRSPGEGNGNPLQVLAWEIPWTEEPVGLQSIGSQSWTRLR